jgi:probable HAF family extracellular repeat protein
MTRCPWPALLTLLATATPALAGPIPPRFTLTELPNLHATDLNDAGQIVGDFVPIDGNGNAHPTRGFLFHAYGPNAGQLRVFSPLPGEYSWQNNTRAETRATAVNASGQVVGRTGSTDYGNGERAFVTPGETMTDLGSLYPYAWSEATAINASGAVVGSSAAPEPRPLSSGTSVLDNHAFLHRDGQMHDLGTLGGPNSRATDINDNGQIVGSSDVGGSPESSPTPQHAFLSDGVPGQPLTNLGTLGGASSSAAAINNTGQVVGSASTSEHQTHAFLFNEGTMRDLGTLIGPAAYSAASDINDKGQIVGTSQAAADSPSTHTGPVNMGLRATLYDQGTLFDLNDLTALPVGWVLTGATAINNLSQIVAQAAIPDEVQPYEGVTSYRSSSVLLTPEGLPAPAPAPVPEPTPLAIILLALSGAGIHRARRGRGRPSR